MDIWLTLVQFGLSYVIFLISILYSLLWNNEQCTCISCVVSSNVSVRTLAMKLLFTFWFSTLDDLYLDEQALTRSILFRRVEFSMGASKWQYGICVVLNIIILFSYGIMSLSTQRTGWQPRKSTLRSFRKRIETDKVIIMAFIKQLPPIWYFRRNHYRVILLYPRSLVLNISLSEEYYS